MKTLLLTRSMRVYSRDDLSAQYQSAMHRGDRAGAKELHLKLKAKMADILNPRKANQ
ncbi:MAG: hypothetical protein U5N55_03545 [Cypionkella sp.]|nr:hypothetical protein [Cypionkella sp.]